MAHVGRRATGNRLIDYLPESDSMQLIRSGQYLSFRRGEVLYRQNGPISYVYFPTRGCCSYTVHLDEGRLIQATTVGKEGMLGIHFGLGLDFSPLTAVCVVPSEAIRVSIQHFQEILKSDGRLDRLLRKYAAYCLLSAIQMIACNTVHSVEERVCRRLLMAHDRTGKDEFLLTQELLGQILGVRRQTITLVAQTLQTAGMIEYRHGAIKILDRHGLEAATCDCYETDRAAYDSIVLE